MKRHIQKQLATLLSGCFVIAGFAVVIWGLLAERPTVKPGRVANSSERSVDNKRDLNSELTGLPSLLKKRLQGPLNPLKEQSKPQEEAVVEKRKSPPPWPPVIVDCVFTGPNSRLAVFSCNSDSYTCTQGDSFLGLRVEKISTDGVVLTRNGETRTFAPLQASGKDRNEK